MNKGRAMFALWVIGTVVTGSLAWTAVAVAGSGGAPDVVRPLTTAEVGALASANPDAGVGSPVDTPSGGSLNGAPGDELIITAFHYDMGSVGVQRAGDQVRFAWATPNAGYHAEVESYGPDVVIVEFEAGEEELSAVIRVVDGELVGQLDDADATPPSSTVADPGSAITQPAATSPSTATSTATSTTAPDDDEEEEDAEDESDESAGREDGEGDTSGGDDPDDDEDDSEDDEGGGDDEKSDED